MNRAERREAWIQHYRGDSQPAGMASRDAASPDIHIRIGEIVIHGLPGLNRFDLAETVRAELSQSLIADGLPAHFRGPGPVPRVDGGQFAIERGARSARVGQHIAGAMLSGAGR
jgi:hypothetical protein